YAVDFNGDGHRDIWSSTEDAIGSVANYLARHNWELDGPVVDRAHVSGERFAEQVDNRQRRPHTPVSQTLEMGWSPVNPLDTNERLASTFRLDGDMGAEFWYGFQNLYVITRYNHSFMYAMAVHQLSQEF
ncbi:MAG: lytic murein transglycosylase, partial [Natronospirillum sp.]